MAAAKESKMGIPTAEFITDVKEYLRKKKVTVEECVRSLNLIHGKYKFLEADLLQRKKALLQKIPDIKSTSECVAFLIKKREDDESTEFESHYRM
eukprot:1393248-Amorphochlora_amoeboformis.AAC.2